MQQCVTKQKNDSRLHAAETCSWCSGAAKGHLSCLAFFLGSKARSWPYINFTLPLLPSMANALFFQLLTSIFSLFCSVCCLDQNSPCYYPNGTDSKFSILDQFPDGDIFKPCFPGNEGHSMCCRRTDQCTHDGTCESPFDGLHWRGTCSDPSWKSRDCLKLCISGFCKLRLPCKLDVCYEFKHQLTLDLI